MRESSSINPARNAARIVNGLIDDPGIMACAYAACGFTAARRYSGPQRRWRLLVALGMSGWTGGQLVWSWYQLFEHRELPSPSLADVGFLRIEVSKPHTIVFNPIVGVVALVAGVALFLIGRRPGS